MNISKKMWVEKLYDLIKNGQLSHEAIIEICFLTWDTFPEQENVHSDIVKAFENEGN